MGKHLIRLEREKQYDQVKHKWAETCQSLASGYLQSVPSISAAATADKPDNQNVPSTEKGWTLKKVRNAVNFSIYGTYSFWGKRRATRLAQEM